MKKIVSSLTVSLVCNRIAHVMGGEASVSTIKGNLGYETCLMHTADFDG
jgi:hypothetical protein